MLFIKKERMISMKKFKKTAKVALAVLMALLMCLSAAVMAGAAEEPPLQRSFAYDNYYTGWTQTYCYAWNSQTGVENAAWPGELMQADYNSSLMLMVLDNVYDHIIFNNGEGMQTFDLAMLDDHDTFFGTKVEQGKVNGFWTNQYNYDTYYFCTRDHWGETDCYASYWGGAVPQQQWPGIKMYPSSFSWYSVKLLRDSGSVIFNNGGNGKQTVTLNAGATHVGLTGNISGYDQYGNALYEVEFLPPF